MAEDILKEAFMVFSDNPILFRELATTILDRDAREGQRFAEQHLPVFGNHASFQRAVALSKQGIKEEAIKVIEQLVSKDEHFREDRYVISKLVSLYIDTGKFEEAIKLLEPLIDANIFTDTRMKQLLSTVMIKQRRKPSKVIELLKNDMDPHSFHLKKQASDILADLGQISIPNSAEKRGSQNEISKSKVFLVHGHMSALKQEVARFLEKLGVDVTILHEQPGQSRSIIGKIEYYADVDFAVVLLTGDDVGASKDDQTNLKPRARQNVIFELGYFMGAIGRDKVYALREKNIDVFSDFSGVSSIIIDGSDSWKLELAKEIKAAGIPIDLNKIL